MLIRFLCLTALFFTSAGFALEFHVAPAGNDGNRGTARKPFATLAAAQTAVRAQLAISPGAAKPITVWVHGGDYSLSQSLEFTAADSGTAKAPVVWRAVKGETVRLLGGRTLSGFHAVTNAAILARLDASTRGHVVETNLRAVGITDFGTLKPRGFGQAMVPAHGELFFNAKPMTLARWPNEGSWELITGSPASGNQNDEHGKPVGKLEEGFHYASERPQRWQDVSNLWVHGYWAYDWANCYVGVASLDVTQRLVKTAPPYGNYGFRKDQRFYFLNILEELDQPGEWFVDRAQGILYFWPPTPLGKTNEVQFSTLNEPLFKFDNVSNVTVRGFTLEVTRGNAVEIRGGANNRIADCLIRNIGNCAVVITGGVGHGVTNCEVYDTGDGGVWMTGGDRQTLTAGGHFVENNRFARQGRWSKTYVPAVQMDGVGLRASHNLIYDHPHCGILFNGNDHLIEFNEIHHIALETGDVGAIYAGRNYTFRGNRIRHNFIHHTGGVGLGAMGVYMDDCMSGTEIYGNIFYKVQRAAFMGGGRDHQVINNIFVDCNYAVELDGRGLDQTPVWRNMVDQMMRPSLAKVPLDLYRARYPAIKLLDKYYGSPEGPALTGEKFTGVPPENNVVARNLSVGKWLNVYWHATLPMLQLENNLTNVDLRFVGTPGDHATAKDYALRKDSPAWKIGFERIPVELIGPK